MDSNLKTESTTKNVNKYSMKSKKYELVKKTHNDTSTISESENMDIPKIKEAM